MTSIYDSRVPVPVETKVGPAQFTVPEDFVAVVNATQGETDFTIDEGLGGGPIVVIPKRGYHLDIAAVTTTSSHNVSAHSTYTNLLASKIFVSGNYQIQAPSSPGFQNGNVYVGPTLIGTIPFSSPTTLNFPFADLPLLNGESIRVTSVTTWFNPPGGNTTYTTSGDGLEVVQTMTLKTTLTEGMVIEGGMYTVELYDKF